MATVAIGTGSITNARVRSAVTMIIGGVRVAYARSSAISKSMRLVFDMNHSAVILEESSRPMLVRRDGRGSDGWSGGSYAAGEGRDRIGPEDHEGAASAPTHVPACQGVRV